jgi:hypothetical protein
LLVTVALQRLINSSAPLSPPYRHRGSHKPNRPTARANRERESRGRIVRPFRLAKPICDGSVRSFAAGSAPVLPSAAGSRRRSGLNLMAARLAPGKAVWLPKVEASHNHANMGRRRVAERHGLAGLGFRQHLNSSLPTPFLDNRCHAVKAIGGCQQISDYLGGTGSPR